MEYSKTHKIILLVVSVVFILCALTILFWPPLDLKTMIAGLILFVLGAQGVYAVWNKKVSWLEFMLEFIGALP